MRENYIKYSNRKKDKLIYNSLNFIELVQERRWVNGFNNYN